MQHIIESPTTVTRKLIVNFEPADVNQYINAAIKEVGKDLTIDGFRKGKVPAKVIEGKFPQEVQQRASDALINSNIQSILSDAAITPISRIKMEEIEGNENTVVKRDAAYSFAVSFEVLPEIALPTLSELSVDEVQAEVTEEELNSFSRRLRQTSAQLTPVTEERTPVDYDVCIVDVEGTFEGKLVPGMKGENIHIQLKPEADPVSGDIEKIVRTLKAGEESTGKIKVVDTYPDPTFRGLEIDMRVKLHSISTEELPEIDEEFVKKFGFEDLEKFNIFMSENIMNQNKQKIKTETQNKLLDQVVDALDFEVPPSLIQAHKSEYLMEARNFLQQQGQEPGEMLEALKRMEDDADTEARKQAKAQAFLMALAFNEKILISEKEVQDYILRAAQESGQDPKVVIERLYQTGGINDINERLLAAKALEHMYAAATKKPVDKDGNPVKVTEENPSA